MLGPEHNTIFDQLYFEIYGDHQEIILKFNPINAAMSKYGMGPLPVIGGFNDAGDSWLPSRFNRSILYLIDAMRFDFTIPIEDDALRNANFHNRLPALNDSDGNFSFYQSIFISDPPTTSQQRVTSIASGSLPNFIEAAFNFAMIESVQDNFLKQAKAVLGPKAIYFFGDSIWTSLFPSILSNDTDKTGAERTLHEFEQKNVHADYSFHIYDLDTVDRNIIKRVGPFLNNHMVSDTSPFMLICHFLGVDHCGHKHGPNSRFMSDKLDEINSFIDFTKSRLDQSTLFYIFGDHGMTDNGEHGGSSLKEIAAGLTMFSRSPLNILNCIEKALYGVPEHCPLFGALQLEFESLKGFFNKLNTIKHSTFVEYDFLGLSKFIPISSKMDKVSQVDFGVNLCLLMGLPIPYSSLGIVIPELYFAVDPFSVFCCAEISTVQLQVLLRKFRVQNGLFLLRVVRLNLLSVIRYYRTLESPQSLHTGSIVGQMMSQFEKYECALMDDEQDLHLHYEKVEDYIVAYMTMLCTLVIKGRSSWAHQNEFMLLFSIFVLFVALVFVLTLGVKRSLLKAGVERWISIPNLAVCSILVLHGVSYFSNSFIIYEYDIVRYVLSSFFLSLFFYRLKSSARLSLSDSYTLLKVLAILKLSYYFGACREEQDLCRYISRDFVDSLSSQYPGLVVFAFFLCFVVSISLCRRLFPLPTPHFLNLAFASLLIFVRWTCMLMLENLHLHDNPKTAYILSLLVANIPKLVYSNFFVGLLVFSALKVLCFLPIVFILLRPTFGAFTMLSTLFLVDALELADPRHVPTAFKCVLLFFSSIFVFFTSGHQFSFSTIQWEVSFYGFLDPSHCVAGLFIFINVFGPSMLVYCLSHDPKDDLTNFDFFLLSCLMLMISCFLFRQHLMLWAVFAPNLIFILLFTLVFGVLSLFKDTSFLAKSTEQQGEIGY